MPQSKRGSLPNSLGGATMLLVIFTSMLLINSVNAAAADDPKESRAAETTESQALPSTSAPSGEPNYADPEGDAGDSYVPGSGLPPDPFGNPTLENNPHAWLNYLGYYLEMGMLGSALALLITTVDLAILKRSVPAILAGLSAIVLAIAGLAVPGLLLLVDKAVDDSSRWLVVHTLQVAWFIAAASMVVLPIAISFKRRQSRKRKLLVTAFSICSSLVSILFWPAAVHWAITSPKPNAAPPPESESSLPTSS
jgi:hypothetical protein